MKVALASDHAGFPLKEYLKKYLADNGLIYEDFGTYDQTPVDYPDLAFKAANAVQRNAFDRGILICGTGIGVAIVANKLKGIRAAPCNDSYSARCARAHNNANILTLGARVIKMNQALEIVHFFLQTPFEGGRHCRRLEKIQRLEEKYFKEALE